MLNKILSKKGQNQINIVQKDFHLLVTQEDMYGEDITKMSNFFDNYIGQLTSEIATNDLCNAIVNIPAADIGIIGEAIQKADVVMADEYSLIPDFDSLPKKIKEKLDSGEYTIGESRQVSDNLRAVILDENGQRVKDVTLKQVRNDSNSIESTTSLATQIQLKQLSAKLDEIQALQSYQIQRDRDENIKVPFLNARDQILKAQNASLVEDRKQYLIKASDELTKALNSAYTDVSTTSEALAKETSRPLFQRTNLIRSYMNYIANDLQVTTRMVGIQMHILDYLGNTEAAKEVGTRYSYMLNDFFNKEIGNRKQSAVLLLHNYYPYTKENRNSWYQLREEMAPVLERGLLQDNSKPIYLLSVEDLKDEQR